MQRSPAYPPRAYARFAARGWLISLLAIWVIGVVTVLIVPTHGKWMPEVSWLLSPFARWDSAWYYRIAAFGYFRPAAYVFFPLYPLVIDALHALTGAPYVAAGVIASWVADLGALLLLARLWREQAGDLLMRRALLLLLAYPSAFFLVAMYAESLYLLLSVGAYLLMRKGHWGWSALLIAFASVERANGILLLLPLLAYAWEASVRRCDAAFWRRALWSLLPIAALGAYLVFSYVKVGNPLEFVFQQATWHRHFTGAGFALGYALIHVFYGQGLPLSILDFFVPLTFLLAMAFDRGKLSLGDKLYIFFGVLSTVLDPSIPNGFVLMSATRLVMPYFPIYLSIAERLKDNQWRWTIAVMGALQVWFWVSYTHWFFAG
ncbi:MAG: mannosyltransferase family protein [Thermaerobacter sp.]|nr:mannosyltransferase family protein [Thermaerobacter sp.]